MDILKNLPGILMGKKDAIANLLHGLDNQIADLMDNPAVTGLSGGQIRLVVSKHVYTFVEIDDAQVVRIGHSYTIDEIEKLIAKKDDKKNGK